MIPPASVIPQLLLPQGVVLAVGPAALLVALALGTLVAFLVRGAIAEFRDAAASTVIAPPPRPALERAA